MSVTAAPPRLVDYFLPPFRRAVGYGELLVKDIPEDKFAHMPHPKMNHPAFNLGHLSIYPNRLLGMIDRSDLILEKPGFPELFKAGTQCVEQDGRYPAKDEIVAYYLERHTTLGTALAEVPDEVFERPNPLEGRMRELFPLIGSAINFLINSHQMSHLGQVSAWRRAIGLGSVF